METLTLDEIANVLATADRTEGGYIRLSEATAAQIAYGLGHADGVIKKLEKLAAKIDRVMSPE